jgi:acyl carrier protein
MVNPVDLQSQTGEAARGDHDVDTLEEVKRIIAKGLRLPIERLTDDTRLEDLGADSLDIIEIVYDLEEKFGISITIKPGESSLLLKPETPGTESMVELGTVADIARVVQSLVEAKSGR